MPLKIYCQCGEYSEYTLNKPIFCAACGTKFEGSISIASQKSKPVKEPIVTENEDEGDDIDETEELKEPINKHRLFGQTSKKSKRIRREEAELDINLNDLNINGLQLAVPISTEKDKGIKFEDLAFQQKTGFERAKPKKVNKKKELEAFRTEAGLGGRKDISIEVPEDKE